VAYRGAVSAGQRYIKIYDLTRDRTEWEVVDVKVVGAALPHALLMNCRDPSDMRTVSCAELTSGGGFALAGTAGAAGDDAAGDGTARDPADGSGPGGRLEAGSARMGRLLRQISLSVHRFKRSWSRRAVAVKPAAAREHRQAN
jgi:hypothetical protein